MVHATPFLPVLALLLGAVIIACGCARERPAEPGGQVDHASRRAQMVAEQIAARGVTDPRILAAMRTVPRERFMPASERGRAHADGPLSIGHGQTISQPYVVAYMTQALGVGPGDRVLEVGTGSGYQAAVLAELGCEVWSIEIVPALAESARAVLDSLGHGVRVRTGDGYRGWSEEAPFDAVIVTAAPDHVPPDLIEQLADGGRLVIPVGDRDQELLRLTRVGEGVVREELLDVRFVPMTGEARD